MIESFPLPFDVRAAFADHWHAPRGGGTRVHEGVDIRAREGTPILAAASGRVLAGRSLTTETPTTGYGVMVRHADGSRALYAHLQAPSGLRPGDRVIAGEPLGNARLGATGNARTTGAHLHFGLYDPDGAAINPFSELARLHDEARAAVGPAIARARELAPDASSGGIGIALLAIGALWILSRG